MINLRKNILKALSEQVPFDNRKPWEKFPDDLKKFLLYGDSKKEFVLKLQAGRGKAKKQEFPGILKDLDDHENHFKRYSSCKTFGISTG